jgi:hypothetical protein
MEEKEDYIIEDLKKRYLVNETVLYDFLQFLKNKKHKDYWYYTYQVI